jgi:hypothetical protein
MNGRIKTTTSSMVVRSILCCVRILTHTHSYSYMPIPPPLSPITLYSSDYRERKSGATRLQACFRSFQSRRLFLTWRGGSITLQSKLRQFYHNKRYTNLLVQVRHGNLPCSVRCVVQSTWHLVNESMVHKL